MRRRLLLQAGGMLAVTSVIGVSRAEGYPSRPITLLVPYAVGGNADITARLFADALSKTMGQSIVVDNRGGGGGSIGALTVLSARPDGYTLLFSAPGVFSVTPHLVKVSYTTKSIEPVCLVSKTPLVLVAKKGSKFKSLSDLVEAAKANPGAVAMGFSGIGTPNHLALLNLEAVGKVRFNGVPYRGSGPMLQDMMAGQIEVGADQISTSRPYIDSGDLIPIAVFGAPLDALPGVKSVSSLGAEPFDVTTYLGIAAARGIPPQAVEALQKATKVALQDARFKDGITKLGSAVYWGTASEYERLMNAENEFVQQMVAAGRIKTE